MVTMGMELSQRADGHPLDAYSAAAERRMIMDEVKNYPPYLDYPKPYKAEVSTDCINRKAFIGEIEKHYCAPCKG